MNRRGDPSEWVDYDFAVVMIHRRAHLYGTVPAGVLLHARAREFLDARVVNEDSDIIAAAVGPQRGRLGRYLDSLVWIARGEERGGPIALLPPSERFHWLTAPRSDLIRTSPVHSGRTQDPLATLERLYAQYVTDA